MSCITCEFFTSLNDVKLTFGYTVYWSLAPLSMTLVVGGYTLYATVAGIKTWLSGEGLSKFLLKYGLGLLNLILMMVFITWKDPSGVPLVYQWVLDPLENLALGFGGMIIGAGLGGGGTAATYGGLAGLVEDQVLFVLQMVASSIQSAASFTGAISGSLFARVIAGILILLPFLFVWGVFAAFMVEAMFKFVAAGVSAPIVLPMAAFPFLRSFPISVLRIVFGAALTIIFASGAMGFTMSVINQFSTPIAVSIAADEALSRARDAYVSQCKGYFTSNKGSLGGLTAEGLADPACRAADETYTDRIKAARDADGYSLWSKEFFMMFVIGFVSILLHLQAKSLASNISGANDGAGPAAATVAAGKMALGGGFMAANSAMFGSGGMKTSLMAAMGQSASGSALAQHGAIGAAPALLKQKLFPDSSPSGGGGGYSSDPFANTLRGGGSMSTGGTDPKLVEALNNLVDSLGGKRPRS